MIENIVKKTREAIRSQKHTKKAVHERLFRAGIITKSGRLRKIYRSSKQIGKRDDFNECRRGFQRVHFKTLI